ncbi:MAG TPA: helix-turn-helix domain-containing protein [Thermoanaerobaculia bacterium]
MAPTEPIDPDLGVSLTLLRVVRGWYQRDVAELARMPRTSIAAYELGKRLPLLASLERILAAMGFDLAAVDEARAFIAALRRKYGLPAAQDRDEVPALWARLHLYPFAVQLNLVAEAREFQHWALAEFLAVESAGAARDDPKRALQLAELGVAVAAKLQGPWGAEVQAFAVAHLGNALRITEDLAGAEAAFARQESLARGARRGLRLLEEARVLAMKAALRRAQRRLPESLALLETARAMNRSESFAPRLALTYAKALAEAGDLEAAIVTLEEATPAILQADEEELLFIHRQGLADCLSKAGERAAAEALLPEVRRLLKRVGGQLHELRVRWVEARVAALAGRRDEAIATFLDIRAAFAELKLAYDCALVSLELATVYAAAGGTLQVKSLARHMVPILQSKGIHREALAALALFRQAAEEERASMELVRQVKDFLVRSRHNAEAVFKEK